MLEPTSLGTLPHLTHSLVAFLLDNKVSNPCHLSFYLKHHFEGQLGLNATQHLTQYVYLVRSLVREQYRHPSLPCLLTAILRVFSSPSLAILRE